MVDLNTKRLADILEQERAALTLADFDQLSSLAQEKNRLLQALPELGLAPAALQFLAAQVDQNQKLFAAVLRGIKAAEMTISGQGNILSGSLVYGRDGKLSQMKTGVRRISQKF